MTRRSLSILPSAVFCALLAGAARADLQGFVSQGHLVLVGGSSAEALTLISDPWNVTVIGNNGTLVNGQSFANFPDVTATVWIWTAGGNDELTINDCELPGSLAVFTGSGNDIVFSGRNVIADSFVIDTGLFGTQSDLVVMTPPFGDASIVGEDLLVLGRDVTLLARGQEVFGRTGVFTGPGADTITFLGNAFHGDVHIRTEAGNDEVSLGDSAELVPNTFGGRLDVRLGAGNDRLLVRRASIAGNAYLSGDWGTDLIESAAAPYGNSFGAALLVAGFESSS